MKDTGIIFTGEMVNPVLDGTKTQTRRLIGPSGMELVKARFDPSFVALPENRCCRYGYAGDRLWVRETYGMTGEGEKAWYIYRADPHNENLANRMGYKWRSSRFMPRVASRITLEITGVRVERLQDITEADAEKEGVIAKYPPGLGRAKFVPAYATLWDSLHKRQGFGWAINPWVWVIDFKRIQP